jgi:hypothetical protein
MNNGMDLKLRPARIICDNINNLIGVKFILVRNNSNDRMMHVCYMLEQRKNSSAPDIPRGVNLNRARLRSRFTTPRVTDNYIFLLHSNFLLACIRNHLVDGIHI